MHSKIIFAVLCLFTSFYATKALLDKPINQTTNQSSDDIVERIDGGFPVYGDPKFYPFVAMRFIKSGSFAGQCGGILIAPTVVLTNAECAAAANYNTLIYVRGAPGIFAFSNSYYADLGYDGIAQDNNIGIVVMKTPALGVIPVDLPTPGMAYNADLCYSAGYGSTDIQGQNFPYNLQEINFPALCGVGQQSQYAYSWRTVAGLTIIDDYSVICAGYYGSPVYKGLCNFDIGGPLICLEVGSTSKFVVVGVNINNAYCAPGETNFNPLAQIPDLFVYVWPHVADIYRVTSALNPPSG